MSSFIHLHTHTQYSLLDGAILIPELIQYIKEIGMDSIAITDHGWMAGVIDFYKECKKNNIKPILGIEAYISEDEDNKEEKTRDNMHMVLLAKNNIGYSKLLELCSNASLNNFYYKPRIYKEKLKELSGNAIALSGCLGGVLAKKYHFELDQYGRAIAAVNENQIIDKEVDFYRDIFGDDFYLELQVWDDNNNYQQVYNEALLALGRDKNIPFVITADAHYLKKEDYVFHETLMAIQMKMTIQEYRESNKLAYGPNFYVADSEEMKRRALSLNCIEAYDNTFKIAEQCDVEIELGNYREPIFKIEEAEDYEEFKQWRENQI